MAITPENLAASIAGVQARIAEAARRSGRIAEDIRLVAVTKYVSTDVIRQLLALGLRDFGESRVQQLAARSEALGAALRRMDDSHADPRPNWHLIGHLQRNKVRPALQATRIVHSVDSLRLAEALSRVAGEMSATADLLLEVNVSGEASKDGLPLAEADAVAAALGQLPNVAFRGLMTMAPATDAGDAARPHFARLRELRDRWLKAGVVSKSCTELSMGMSGDFEAAILEGSTCVRLGSVLYGDAAAVQNPVQNPPG